MNQAPSSPSLAHWIRSAGVILRPLKACLWLTAGLLMFYPLLWTLLNSFKTSNLEIFEHPFHWPEHWSLQNYKRALLQGNLLNFFANSISVTLLSTLGVVVFGAAAGFALRDRQLPFRKFWAAIFMAAMILPTQAYVIPLLDLTERLGIYNTLWALILPYIAQSLPLAILLFAAFFSALPRELEEIARLDGVPPARFFCFILLPVAKPALATIALLASLNSWNEFLLALLLVTDSRLRTLPAGMVAFEQVHNTDYPALLAGLSLSAIPVLVIYWIFNRQIVRGVVAGAVK